MDIRLLETDSDGLLWNNFIRDIPGSTVYHRWEWQLVYSRAYGFQPRYWAAFEGNKVCGVFPAVLMRGLNLRKNWVSLPFVTAAGPVHTSESEISSFAEAVLAREKANGIRCFQVRAAGNISLDNCSNFDAYVTMVLDLANGSDYVWEKQLQKQKRRQVRKAGKNNLVSVTGKLELLDDFYDIWTQRINQLGTPVFSKQFFSEILTSFGDDVWIQAVQKNGFTVGVMLVLMHNGKAFPPWAATRSEFNSEGANSLLYWSVIEEACRRGCITIDMGRSEREGATFKLKGEWGAKPISLRYFYDPAVTQDVSAGDKYQSLIRLWQRQPDKLANITGPFVTRFLTDL